jgi:serine/threonine-protein kinase RIO1
MSLSDDLSQDKFIETTLSHIEPESHHSHRKGRHSDIRSTLDSTTSSTLRHFVDSGILLELGDCISSSKSSSVFIGLRGVQAPSGWPSQFAVKIRSLPLKYNSEFHSFRTEMSSIGKLPKAIAHCAKNEYHNITRIYSHSIPCPCPLMVQKSILLMELISDNDTPAKSLHDSILELAEYDDLYGQVLIGIRRTFHRCGFVWADLSEHSILVRRKRAVWTGAARVVERDDETATFLLKRGIARITQFFSQRGVETVPMIKVFQFVVARRLEAGLHPTLAELKTEREEMSAEEFLVRFTPSTLVDVKDEESAQGLIRVEGHPLFEEEDEPELEMEKSSSDDEEEEEEEDQPPMETLDRKQFTREAWKAKVREIKLANRERRKAHKPQLEKRQQKRRSHRNAK